MKRKLFTCCLLFFMLPFIGLSQNLLTNGGFDAPPEIINCNENTNPASWCAFSMDTNNAHANVEDDVCVFHVLNPSPQNWEVQLIQGGFNLEAGHVCNLTFDVKADQMAPFGVFIGEVGGGWTNLLSFDGYMHEASTEWQTISLDFNSPVMFAEYKVSFEFGHLSNTAIYFDNVILTEVGTYVPNLGIVGDAVYGWEGGDAFMETTDGVQYTLMEFPLNMGQLKFRLDGDWLFNWGPPWNQDPAFPAGIAVMHGQNIPIPTSGIYNISFNLATGEYHFDCVSNCAVEIGVTGTAVPPFFSWDDNHKMHTPDGENYFIPFRYFGNGEVKFRQLDNWDNNWGGSALQGTAVPGGQGIPVAEAFYSVHFNLNTLEYHFEYPFIGMIGSALEGWGQDVPMETNDGIHYTLAEHYFSQGEVKFRANRNWRVNFGTNWGNPWGGFPGGTAVYDQMNIFVPAGFYSVEFNLQTKDYHFEGTPCLECPQDIFVYAEPDICGAVVDFPELFVNEICGTNFTIEQHEGLPDGSVFPPGHTHQVFVAHNDEGQHMHCSFNVWVEDRIPAEILYFTADYEMPWPPNHQMIPVTLDYEIVDICEGEITHMLNIWHNEEDMKGAGNALPDYEIIDDHHVLVRAERSGNGNGREYHIELISVDENQNHNMHEVVVRVEHDNGKSMGKSALIDIVDPVRFGAEVYPNPARDKFYLNLNFVPDNEVSMVIFDVNGRVVQKTQMKEKLHVFGSDLIPGIYLLQLQTAEICKTYKIVKE